MSGNAKMVINIGNMRFEKFPSSNTVSIYVGNEEVNCFTHYEIGSDFEKFKESCEGQVEYLKSQME